MKTYELTYLINPELTEEQINELFSNIESALQESKGILTGTRKHKIMDLGNEIKKHKKALLAVTKFQIAPENQKLLQEKMKQISEILRFSVLNFKPAHIGKAVPKLGKKPKQEIKTFKKKKVELEKIEEKLEELLR